MITRLLAGFATLVVLKYISLVESCVSASYACSRFAALCCFAEGPQEEVCEVGERGIPEEVAGTGQRNTVLEYPLPTLEAPGQLGINRDP
jgi:hypothetical protein